jgi:hypothetical protein
MKQLYEITEPLITWMDAGFAELFEREELLVARLTELSPQLLM